MNLKKIGLTALAGSLVATSVYAGEMTISGTAKMTYSTKDGNQDSKLEANRWGLNQDMAASVSGELDNGFVVTLTHLFDGDAYSDSSYLNVDMGDLGTLAYIQDDLGGGLEAYDDMMPTAYEEVSDGIDSTATRSSMAAESGFYYGNSMNGISFSVQYDNGGAANDTGDGGIDGGAGKEGSYSIGASYAVGDTGLTVFGGMGQEGQLDGKEIDETGLGFTYAMGAFQVGYQHNESDDSDAAGTDYETDMYGISFSVNENLSVSYGLQTTEKSGTSVEQDVKGFDIGYSMGGMTISAYNHKAEDLAHSAGNTSEKTEIALTFAF